MTRPAPAASRKDDSDLGQRLVTIDVPPLPPALVQQALQAGLAKARTLQQAGLIFSAVLVCQQQALQTSENAPLSAPQAMAQALHGLVLA